MSLGSLVKGKSDPEGGIECLVGVFRQRGKGVDGPSCSVGGGSRRVSGFVVSRREEGEIKRESRQRTPFRRAKALMSREGR